MSNPKRPTLIKHRQTRSPPAGGNAGTRNEGTKHIGTLSSLKLTPGRRIVSIA